MRGGKRSKATWEAQVVDYLKYGERLPGLAIVSAGSKLTCWRSPNRVMCRECGAGTRKPHQASKPHLCFVSQRGPYGCTCRHGQAVRSIKAFRPHWLLVKSRYLENSGVWDDGDCRMLFCRKKNTRGTAFSTLSRRKPCPESTGFKSEIPWPIQFPLPSTQPKAVVLSFSHLIIQLLENPNLSSQVAVK